METFKVPQVPVIIQRWDSDSIWGKKKYMLEDQIKSYSCS